MNSFCNRYRYGYHVGLMLFIRNENDFIDDIKAKSLASARDFLCFKFRLYFVLSRTTLVRNVAPFWEPSMRSVLSFALSLAVSATLPTAFALFLAMTASLKTKYRQKTLFLQDLTHSGNKIPTTHLFLLSLSENYYFYQV